MNKNRICTALAIVLFAVVLTGCSKEVKNFPPLDKNTPAEKSAVLIIPAKATVTRIDGAKRGWFSSWSPGTKAATLLVPAGKHTIIFEYSDSANGWAVKNLEYPATMRAGKIYMLFVTRDEKAAGGVISSAVNIANSFVRDQIVDRIPFIDILPRANTKGLVFQVNEIDQTIFEQYLLDGGTKIALSIYLLSVLIGGVWWGFIICRILRWLVYVLFMGRFKNSHPVAAFIFAIVLGVNGIFIINYNSNGVLLLYILATLFISICLSFWDMGDAANKKGLAALKGKSVDVSQDAAQAVVSGLAALNGESVDVSQVSQVIGGLYEALSADKKFKNNYEKAANYFTEAISQSCFNADYVNNRGIAYFGLQDWEKALADFTEAIKLEPNNAAYINWRGIAYCKLQDYGKAITDFTEAVRLKPYNDTFKKNLANAQAASGKKATAPPIPTTPSDEITSRNGKTILYVTVISVLIISITGFIIYRMSADKSNPFTDEFVTVADQFATTVDQVELAGNRVIETADQVLSLNKKFQDAFERYRRTRDSAAAKEVITADKQAITANEQRYTPAVGQYTKTVEQYDDVDKKYKDIEEYYKMDMAKRRTRNEDERVTATRKRAEAARDRAVAVSKRVVAAHSEVMRTNKKRDEAMKTL